MTGQTDLVNLMTLRQTIEVTAAAMAAERRSYLHLHQMRHALDKMREYIGKTRFYVRYDFEFHLTLLEASENILFDLIVKGLREAVYETMIAACMTGISKNGKETYIRRMKKFSGQ